MAEAKYRYLTIDRMLGGTDIRPIDLVRDVYREARETEAYPTNNLSGVTIGPFKTGAGRAAVAHNLEGKACFRYRDTDMPLPIQISIPQAPPQPLPPDSEIRRLDEALERISNPETVIFTTPEFRKKLAAFCAGREDMAEVFAAPPFRYKGYLVLDSYKTGSWYLNTYRNLPEEGTLPPFLPCTTVGQYIGTQLMRLQRLNEQVEGRGSLDDVALCAQILAVNTKSMLQLLSLYVAQSGRKLELPEKG